jgi:hypothetical protein
MATDVDSSSFVASESDVDPPQEYYEEVDNQRLDFRKRKVPTPKPVVKKPPVVDPIQKLNEQLNRQFRPDLVC